MLYDRWFIVLFKWPGCASIGMFYHNIGLFCVYWEIVDSEKKSRQINRILDTEPI